MNKVKRAIVASLTGHPDAEKYLQRATSETPERLVSSLGAARLTKADFLSLDDDGKPFMDTAAAWRNFGRIAEIIALSGEKFTYEDLTKPLTSSSIQRTLLDSARGNDGISQLFSADIWKGRYQEMENLWFKIPPYDRKRNGPGTVPLEIKREIYAAEGKRVPEDALSSANLTTADLQSAASSDYYFKEATKRLQSVGDHWRKEYVLLLDASGDTMFSARDGFAKFPDIVRELQAHGERLEVSDYTRQAGNAPGILARASEQKALDKVFAPAQWADRLPDMLELWSHVKDAWKTSPLTTQDFDNAYSAAEGMTYAKVFAARSFAGKDDLLQPLNAGKPGEKPVLPLGLKVVWENLEAISSRLSSQGEKLTLSDLRVQSGQMGETCLVSAAKFGQFDKVMRIAHDSNEPLAVKDYLARDSHGTTLIDVIASKGQLDQVFTASAWVGNIGDMRALWSHVSVANRKQVDFDHLETAVKQATLKQRRDGVKIRPTG